MVGIFKQKNPGNALVLLIYALVLKFSVFLHPVIPPLHKEDNFVYRVILNELAAWFKGMPVFFSVLTFLLLFTQATLFNRICNYQKLFPKANYLPGMSYILVTSLLPSWNYFSAPLLVNSVMIWVFFKMSTLYNSNKTDGSIFNIGVMTGIITLLYLPAMAFILLVFFALLIMRPFRLREWFMGLLGFTTPYYFLFIVLYLTNKWSWKNIVPEINFRLPGIPSNIWVTAGIVLLVVPFIIGGYFIQSNLNKMLIQIRKNWSLLLLFLMVGVIIILINHVDLYENWIVTAVPFSAFHAAAYYYSNDKILPSVTHWLTFAFILWVNYLV
ncbi:MAG: hypothetical protein JST47_14760 [Bacteroidetes bacterium]|nr:hypothetical protein [Bacteroidota bacterium]MBS1974367.1 hypothetical protein [Bacteroidota bacterium]